MTIGFSFPFIKATGSLGHFQMTNDEFSALESNIRVLLTTNRGERVMHYDFGCSLRDFLFEQQKDEILKIKIADRINYQFNKWLPFLIIDELNIFFSNEKQEISENQIGIFIKYRLSKKPDAAQSVAFII